jgi:glycerol-3-phosphate dehydrogenase (NAD(P)+)
MVITRGLAEMTRLGAAAGADRATFAGLTGLGDLMATCISPLSRNRRVGEEIAQGRSVAEITAGMKQVAEGVKSAAAVIALAEELGVSTPIASEVDAVVNHGRTAVEAFRGLRRVRPRSESHAA